VSSASERGVPTDHIMKATGHKTPAMISIYNRITDLNKNSALKGSRL
jgi:hypothetical protein